MKLNLMGQFFGVHLKFNVSEGNMSDEKIGERPQQISERICILANHQLQASLTKNQQRGTRSIYVPSRWHGPLCFIVFRRHFKGCLVSETILKLSSI